MSTQVVAQNARHVFPRVIPASSPFSELLRRSKFASFDPEIRQAYSAPASYTHRGNYGLKRQIANRKKHGYIVLKKFEEHAQYIEWDNAKEQVRWLRRVEDMHLRPILAQETPWAKGLGPIASAKESWIDSDFCPGERAYVARPAREKAVSDEITEVDGITKSLANVERMDPNKLPRTRGRGRYGAKSDLPPVLGQQTFLQPNFSTMPPRVFEQYLKQLRDLRSEFLTFVRQELKNGYEHNPTLFNPDNVSDEELVANHGRQLWGQNFHLRFLAQKTETKYHAQPVPEELGKEDIKRLQREATATANEPQPIHPQPHILGGMMYAAPTLLESAFYSKPQHGFYLQNDSGRGYYDGRGVTASFAGMTARVLNKDTTENALFDGNVGGQPDKLTASKASLRITHLHLHKPPVVVGKSATNYPISELRIGPIVVPASTGQSFRRNAEEPGSFAYSSTPPVRASSFFNSSPYGSMKHRAHYDLSQRIAPSPSVQNKDEGASKDLLTMLKNMSPAVKRAQAAAFQSQRRTAEPSDSGEGGKSG